jgi:hypothetical protein
MRKKDHHPIYHCGKLCGDMILHIPAFFPYLQDSHQFSFKIQVTTHQASIKGSKKNCMPNYQ